MRKFTVIYTEEEESTGFTDIIRRYGGRRFGNGEVKGVKFKEINIGRSFVRIKKNILLKTAELNNRYVLSRDLHINIDEGFRAEIFARGLDFFMIKNGCDLRMGEVLILSDYSLRGIAMLRKLAVFAGRIVILTEDRKSFAGITEKLSYKYGVSILLSSDPIKASEKSDAAVIISEGERTKLKEGNSMPVFRADNKLLSKGQNGFEDIVITDSSGILYDSTHIQGWFDVNSLKSSWSKAEEEGFDVGGYKIGNDLISR